MEIRPFHAADEAAVIALWDRCQLTRPWNDPKKDLQRKLGVQRELFLVGVEDDAIVAAVMAAYDGHRGSVNYLAVDPKHRRRGYGMVRSANAEVLAFYRKLGYTADDVVPLGKRLIPD